MSNGVPHMTMTFLLTDIEGSTRQWEESPYMSDLVDRHFAVREPALGRAEHEPNDLAQLRAVELAEHAVGKKAQERDDAEDDYPPRCPFAHILGLGDP